MKKTVGATFKDFTNQFPPTMAFYKRRYAVQKALAAIRRGRHYKETPIINLFRERWQKETETAKKAGWKPDRKALIKKWEGKEKRYITRFFKKYGYNPIIKVG